MPTMTKHHENRQGTHPEHEPDERLDREQDIEASQPIPPRWPAIACGAFGAVGVAWAAAFVSVRGVERDVGVAAWVAAAVVGASATISAAAGPRRFPRGGRPPQVARMPRDEESHRDKS